MDVPFSNNSDYREPTKKGHNLIADYIVRHHFSEYLEKQSYYFDEDKKEFSELNPYERKILPVYLKEVLSGFGAKLEEICDNLGYKGKSCTNVSKLTKVINFYLKEFCSERNINPPFQLFYYHKNRFGKIKDHYHCHLACAEVGIQDNNHCYSYNIVSFKESEEYSISKVTQNVDSKIKEFRDTLKQEALSGLNDKLGTESYIPLNLQIGMTNDFNNDELIDFGYNHNRRWEEFALNKLHAPQGVYILSSETGSGKTTFLRNLQHAIIKETDSIPVFLEASELESLKFKKRNLNSFLKSLSDLLDQGNYCYDFLKRYPSKLIFLIDGLDQIEGSGMGYANLIEKLLTVVNNRVIVTSRPFAVVSKEMNGNIKFLRLENFTETDQEQYFGENYVRAKELCKTCPDMLRVPMLAYMVRTLIVEGKDKAINNRAQLYNKFINHILENHMSKNLGLSLDDIIEVRDILGRISYRAIANNLPYLQKIPYKFAKICLNKKNTNIEIETLLKSGLPGTVINESGGEYMSLYFNHQSLQEYLAAEYVTQSNNLTEKILAEKWNPKWKEVIKFIVGIRGEEIIKKIFKEKDNPINSKLLLCAELISETKTSSELRCQIWEKGKILFDIPMFAQDVQMHMAFFNINRTEVMNRIFSYLSAPDNAVWGLAIRLLEKLKDEVDINIVNQIVGILADKDKNISHTAAIALGKLHDKTDKNVINQLFNMLNNENAHVRRSVLVAFKEFRGVGANITNKIADSLIDKDTFVGDLAATALGRLYDTTNKDMTNKILSMLNNENAHVRHSVLVALKKFKEVSASIMNKIVDMLVDKDVHVRCSAAIVLGRFCSKPNKNIRNKIAGMLDDENAHVRQSAIEAFGQLKGKVEINIVNKITTMLDDNDVDVSCSAIRAIGHLCSKTDKDIKNKIASMLINKNADIRCSAFKTLVETGNEIDIGKMLSDESSMVLFWVILAIIGYKEFKIKIDIHIINKLAEMANDKDENIRILAVIALGRLKDATDINIANKIIHLLDDRNIKVRCRVIEALGVLKDEVDINFIPKIVDMLEDKNEAICSSAANALAELKNTINRKMIEKIITFKNVCAIDLLRLLYQDGKLEFLTETCQSPMKCNDFEFALPVQS